MANYIHRPGTPSTAWSTANTAENFAAMHGLVGLMRAYANVLGPYNIRCNTIHPTGVNAPMVVNPEFAALAQEQPTLTDGMRNTLPIPLIEAVDVSNAMVYLCSPAIPGVVQPYVGENTES